MIVLKQRHYFILFGLFLCICWKSVYSFD